MNLGIRLDHRLGIEWLLAGSLAERFETLLNRRLVVGELLGFCRDRLTALLGEETAIEIRGLILERTRAMDEALTALRLQYPDFRASCRAAISAGSRARWKPTATTNGGSAPSSAARWRRPWRTTATSAGPTSTGRAGSMWPVGGRAGGARAPVRQAGSGQARLDCVAAEAAHDAPRRPDRASRPARRCDVFHRVRRGRGADPRQTGGAGRRRVLRRAGLADRPAAQRGRRVPRLLPPAGADSATSRICSLATPTSSARWKRSRPGACIRRAATCAAQRPTGRRPLIHTAKQSP